MESEREEWPTLPGNSELEVENAMKEKRKSDPNVTHALLTSSISLGNIKDIIDIEIFSDKGKLMRTFAWVLRFIKNVKSAANKESLNKEAIISVLEMNSAEKKVIRFIKNECFKNEIDYLMNTDTAISRKRLPCM